MNGYEIRLTFDFLPVLGVVMSLAGFYLPFFKDWYSTLCIRLLSFSTSRGLVLPGISRV